MSSLMIGAGIGIVGLLIMLTGIPIAFALGIVAVGAMLLFLDVFQFNIQFPRGFCYSCYPVIYFYGSCIFWL